jgi:glycosyltransferase involved in cell wall biosynthesis
MYCMVSPWPPQRNGIADYSYEIAMHTDAPLLLVTEALGARPCENVERILASELCDRIQHQGIPAVYHIGNNPDHAFMVPLLLGNSGIAVVHDTSLHYLIETADTAISGLFAGLLEHEYGSQAALMLRCWKNANLKRMFDYREVNMLGWLRQCKSICVHSEYARRLVMAHVEGVPVEVLPHFAYHPLSTWEELSRGRALARKKLGVEKDTLLISTVGFVTRNKQYASIMRAIRALPGSIRQNVLFLIAGEVRTEEYDIHYDISVNDCAANVRILGYLDDASMRDVLLASDVIFNLRYPTFGESSGSLARAFGLGCITAVTNAGSYAELPDSVCFKMPARQDPAEEIMTLLTDLMSHPEVVADRRRATFNYALNELSVQSAAQRYLEIAGA